MQSTANDSKALYAIHQGK